MVVHDILRSVVTADGLGADGSWNVRREVLTCRAEIKADITISNKKGDGLRFTGIETRNLGNDSIGFRDAPNR